MGSLKQFDMLMLYKLGELRVRIIADALAVSAAEYFEKLTKLIDLAPSAKWALERFIARDAEKEDYKTLDTVASVLKDIGCEEFVASIYSILEAYEKGNWRLAAHHASTISDSFGSFCSRVRSARKTIKAEYARDTNVSLKEYVGRIDEEEKNRKPIILAVDDSPVILKSVSAVLGGIYKVFTLPKPTALETVLQKLTPDLFLLDYRMPELDGFDLIPIIRSFEEHKNTPIIFLTAIGTFENVTAALALGACDFVIKPFDPNVLKERIAKHI